MINLNTADYGTFLMLKLPWKEKKVGIGLADVNSDEIV
jgi:hypothetical protein